MAIKFLSKIEMEGEYTFPLEDGNANQVLSTNGAGVVSFVDLNTLINTPTLEQVLLAGSISATEDPIVINVDEDININSLDKYVQITGDLGVRLGGPVKFNNYGLGNNTGTASKIMLLTSTGDVIEGDINLLDTPNIQAVLEAGATASAILSPISIESYDSVDIIAYEDLHVRSEEANSIFGADISDTFIKGTTTIIQSSNVVFDTLASTEADGTPVKSVGVNSSGKLVKYPLESNQDLQSVTDEGNVTTNSITVNQVTLGSGGTIIGRDTGLSRVLLNDGAGASIGYNGDYLRHGGNAVTIALQGITGTSVRFSNSFNYLLNAVKIGTMNDTVSAKLHVVGSGSDSSASMFLAESLDGNYSVNILNDGTLKVDAQNSTVADFGRNGTMVLGVGASSGLGQIIYKKAGSNGVWAAGLASNDDFSIVQGAYTGDSNVRLKLNLDGTLHLLSYGTASPITGTAAKILAVDSDGKVIEVDQGLTDIPTLQEVTDEGNVTTNDITASSFTTNIDAANSSHLLLNSPVTGVNVNFDFIIGSTLAGLAPKNLEIIGSSSGSDIAFSPSIISRGLLALDGSANMVGIGITSPSAKLHIVGSGNTSGTTALLIENSDSDEIFSIANNGVVTIKDPSGTNLNTIINNDPSLSGTTGTILTALGHRALRNSTGNRNVGIGYEAGGNISGTGTGESTSVGYYAGNNFVGAGYITAIGSNALRNATTSSSFNRSVAVGVSAGYAALNIATCVFIGANSGADSDGNSNIALGFSSLRESTGSNNISIGSSAGYQTTTSNDNILIGNRSAFGATIGSGNVFIGNKMQDGSTENLTNTIILGASELERLRIDSSGNMGLATTSPSARLHVVGSGNTSATKSLLVENSTGLDLFSIFDNANISSRVNNVYFRDVSNNEIYLQISNNSGEGSIDWKDNGTVTTRIRANGNSYFNGGNVGIGTSTPFAKLHVYGSNSGASGVASGTLIVEQGSAPAIQILSANTQTQTIKFGDPEDGDVGRIEYSHPDNSMTFVTNGNDNLYIDSSGDVGIGTTSPSYKLHVNTPVGSAGIYVEDSDGEVGLIVYDNKEVGIGTLSTASRLHIRENNDFVFSNAGFTLEQAGTGDAVMQFVLTDTARVIMGLDNSDGDKFKISQNTNLGTDTHLTIDSSGQLTFNNYGSNTFTGTVAKLLAVDSSGNVIETDSGLTDVPTLQEVTDAGNVTTNDIVVGGLEVNGNSTLKGHATVGNGTLDQTIRFQRTDSNVLEFGKIISNGEIGIGGQNVGIISFNRSLGEVARFHNDNFIIGGTSALAKLHVVGSGNTNATTALLIENSDGDDMLTISDNKVLTANTTTYINEGLYVNSQKNLFIRSADNLDYSRWIQVGGALRLYTKEDGESENLSLYIFGTGQVRFNQYTGTNFDDASPSSILGVDASGNVVKTDASNIVTDIPTLQEVTDAGATTTNNLTIGDSTTGFSATFNRGLKVGSTSGFIHYFSAGNANIIGNSTVLESSFILSPSAPDATTTSFRFNNTSNKLTTSTVVGGNTISNKHFTIDSDGNIGMNTLNPSAKLHVVGETRIEDDRLLIDYAEKENKDFIKINAGNVSNAFELKTNVAGDTSFSIKDFNSNIGAFINSRGNSYLTGGNVGIGTTSPSAKLGISDSNSNSDFNDFGSFYFENEDLEGLSMGYDTDGNYSWLFSRERGVSSRGLRLNGSLFVNGYNGNVGIGTTNPNSKLHVVGSGNTSSTTALLIENTNGANLITVNNSGVTQVGDINNTNSEILRIASGSTNAYIGFFPTNNSTREGYIGYLGEDMYIVQRNNKKIKFYTNDSLRLEILNTGQLKLNEYTGGSFDGTPQHFLGVDGSGNVVKTTGAGNLSNTWLQATDDRDMAPEDISFDVDFGLFFSSKLGLDTGTTTDADYQDVIYLNTWSDASGGDANILAFDKSTMQILHYQADQAATNWGTPKTLAYAEDVTTPTLQEVTDEGNKTNTSIVINSSNNAVGELDVYGSIVIGNKNASNSSTAGVLYFREAGTTWGTDMYGFRVIHNGAVNKLNIQSANQTDVKELISLDRDSGDIGINTTTPSAKLHVVSSSGTNGLIVENTVEQIFKVGLNVGDIKTGDSQIFYQGALADNYLGDMDSFNGFRLGRFKGTGSLNQAFTQHHLIMNLPSSDQNIYEAQLAFETTGGAVPNGGFKFRNSSAGTWSDWYTVYHSGNGQTLQEVTDAGNVTSNSIVTTADFNSTPSSDQTILSKYGLISNRASNGTMYITNGSTGQLVFGFGATHAANNQANLSTSGFRIGDGNQAQAKLDVIGSGGTNATTTFNVENSSGRTRFKILDGDKTYVNSETIIYGSDVDDSASGYKEVIKEDSTTIAGLYNVLISDSNKKVISVDYVLNDGTNYRTGTATAITDGTTTSISDITKAEIGDTSNANFISTLNAGNLRVMLSVDDSGWDVKYIIKNF